jgi:hypothetical protein
MTVFSGILLMYGLRAEILLVYRLRLETLWLRAGLGSNGFENYIYILQAFLTQDLNIKTGERVLELI